MKVLQYMQAGATTLLPEAPLSKVREVMEEHGFGLLFVASAEGKLVGFITRGGLKDTKDWESPVEKHCHAVKFSVTPGDTLEKAALIMLTNRLVVLPVLEEERLIGVITQAELLKGFTQGLGIGLEATRLTARLRKDSDDLYRVCGILEAHEAEVISMVRGADNETHAEMIFRVRGVADREKLCADLEAALRQDIAA